MGVAIGIYEPRVRPPAQPKTRRMTVDESSFQDKMNQILDRIRELPSTQASEAADGAETRRARVQTSVTELQDALDYLRLSVKYLVFDLEATRRENAYLRRMIEQSNRERNQKPDESQDEERPEFGSNGWE
jgi:ElaB/YqjD/DUF883 family membrane-anchored ribosome-binding protein